MSLHYKIKVDKDHALVKATWDVNVPRTSRMCKMAMMFFAEPRHTMT